MCGISGIVHKDRSSPVDFKDLKAMADRLTHRGPDDEGVFVHSGVGLSFRRLSIIDLSPAGHQPMTTPDGSLTLVCNGEIYNHLDLRERLRASGFKFQSRTDIEVILHAYAHWGLEALNHLDGMFAFALWDANKQQVLLARDRLGIKPLCYYEDDSRFAFASELPALWALPGIDRELDPGALWNYLSELQVPAPQTPFRRIRKFLPGQAMLLSWPHEGRLSRHTWHYWRLPPPVPSSQVSFSDAAKELRRLMESAVRSHLVGDVPVGVCLSGGLDSSVIAALASRAAKEPLKTFSATFPGFDAIDESGYQKLIVDRYRTEHQEFRAGSDVQQFTRELIRRLGEPYAVMSAIPLLGVSRLASGRVKVILSGDGSDELLAGYGNRYVNPASWETLDRLPVSKGAFARAHGVLAALGGRFNRGQDPYGRLRKHLWDGSQSDESRHRERRNTAFSIREKVRLFSEQTLEKASGDGDAVYRDVWQRSGSLVPARTLDYKLYFEMNTVLPDEMLRKVDLCSSCASIEGRVPFMDRAVVEFAATIPLDYKLRGNQGKQILKAAFEDLIPTEILHRPKQGFNVPLQNWTDGLDFRPLAEGRLPFIRAGAVREILDRRERGENWNYPLWILENYRVWLEEFEVEA